MTEKVKIALALGFDDLAIEHAQECGTGNLQMEVFGKMFARIISTN